MAMTELSVSPVPPLGDPEKSAKQLVASLVALTERHPLQDPIGTSRRILSQVDALTFTGVAGGQPDLYREERAHWQTDPFSRLPSSETI
jgi:hypothetical protein